MTAQRHGWTTSTRSSRQHRAAPVRSTAAMRPRTRPSGPRRPATLQPVPRPCPPIGRPDRERPIPYAGSPELRPTRPGPGSARPRPPAAAGCHRGRRRAPRHEPASGARPGSARRRRRPGRCSPTGRRAGRRRSATRRRVCAANGSGRTEAVSATAGATVATGSLSGACSMMACAFVPLIPNADTPARRTPPDSHDVASETNSTPPSTNLIRHARHMQRRGNTPCRIARTILMTPATPAAACVCPMFDLTEPSHKAGPRH